jgi:hypothetical protein
MEGLGMKIQHILERGKLKSRGVAASIESQISQKTIELQTKVEERDAIERTPMTRAELLMHCKKELAEGRTKRFLENIILPHVKQVQLRNMPFLWEVIVHKDLGNEGVVGNYLFGILSDEMIEAAVAQCPDIGISEGERKKQLAVIDKQIVQIESEIEKLL